MTTTYLPANAAFGDGFYTFFLPAGLAQGMHTITVGMANNSSVTAVSNSFNVAANTGTIPVVTYPSVQSQPAPVVQRAGFNPNLNVPYGNDQFNNFFNARDWTNTIALGYAGKGGRAGWRNQPSWRRTASLGYGSYGSEDNYWNVAFRTIYAVKARTGSSTILNVYANSASYTIPVGDPMVFFIPTVDDAAVATLTTFPFTNFAFPLKTTVMTVVDATSVTLTDSSGNPILTSSGATQTVTQYGIQLPAGLTVPAGLYWDQRAGVAAVSLNTPILYARHNSFYVNSQTLQPRWQIAQMIQYGRDYVCQNGGVFDYGGDQGEPTYRDYWFERSDFGDTVAYSFLGGEADWVGAQIAQFPDPSLVLIELENEPTGPWTNVVNGVDNGVRDMIVNFLIPRWRAALGPNYTIGVKGTNYGAVDWALANADIVFPNDGPYAWICHIYDEQQSYSTVYPDPTKPAASNYNTSGSQIYFTGDSAGQYVADALSVLKARTGATIVGLTEFGIDVNYTQKGPYLNPPGYATVSNSNESYRGRMIGSVISPIANMGGFTFIWSYVGDGNDCDNFYLADGLTYNAGGSNDLEMLFPALRNEAALVNTQGSLTGITATTVFPSYMPPAVNVVPTFSLNAVNVPVSVPVGGSTTTTIQLGATYNYGGTVTLSTSGAPTGVTLGLSNNTFTTIGHTTQTTDGADICTVTVNCANTVSAGAYTITVSATDGTITLTDTIDLVVGTSTVLPSFAISPTTASHTVAQGASVAATFTLIPTGAYTSTDTISLGSLPTGVTGTLSTNSIADGSGSFTVTLAASNSAAVTTDSITVTATDGTLTRNATISLNVIAAPSTATYTLSPTSASVSLVQGKSSQTTLTLSPSGSYTGTDTFSIGTLPSGVAAALSANSITNGSGSTVLTLTATGTATIGSSTVTITVTDGTTVHTTSISLAVSAAPASPSYTLTPKSTSTSVTQSSTSTTTITLTPSGGYTGTDAFSIGALPTGVTAALSNATLTNGTGTTVVTFTASSTAAAGNSAVTITCSDGVNSPQSCVIELTVVASVSVTSGAITVTLNPQNPLYATTTGTFSGTISNPSMALYICFRTTGVPSLSQIQPDGDIVQAVVQANGTWSVYPVTIDHPGTTSTIWALLANGTVTALESVVPVTGTAPPPVSSTPLSVGNSIVSTAGTGVYTITCGAVSGGTVPYTYQFQRVLYTSGAPGATQPIGPSGTATTYQDSSLPLNTTAGYFVTVTDSSSPAQVVTTIPNVITYGTPTGAVSTSGTTLDTLAALIQSVQSGVTTLVSDNNSAPTTTF